MIMIINDFEDICWWWLLMIIVKFDDDDDKFSCVISDLLCNESGARAAITITERGITWEPEDIDHRDYMTMMRTMMMMIIMIIMATIMKTMTAMI